MKGLLLKDFFLLIKACKSILIVIAVFICAGFVSQAYSFLHIYVIVLASLIPVTLFAYDENDKWNLYVQTLPVTKASYVSAKYVIGLISELIALVLCIINQVIISKSREETIVFAVVTAVMGMLCPSVSMPVLFKYGSVKGRFVNIILIAATAGISSFFLAGSDNMDILDLSVIGFKLAAVIVFIFSVLVYALSWLISVKIYDKREI